MSHQNSSSVYMLGMNGLIFYLVGLIEEVFDPGADSPDEPKGVTNHIQTQYQHIELLDGLVGEVTHHLRLKLLGAVELVLTLKETKPVEEIESCFESSRAYQQYLTILHSRLCFLLHGFKKFICHHILIQIMPIREVVSKN